MNIRVQVKTTLGDQDKRLVERITLVSQLLVHKSHCHMKEVQNCLSLCSFTCVP